jgi:hypothetical protein
MKKFSHILGYHTNPYTCGVAKFNSQLAKFLNIEVLNIKNSTNIDCTNALLSIKVSEFNPADLSILLDFVKKAKRYSLFLHGFNDTEIEWFLLQNASIIYCGNTEIYNSVHSTGKAKLLFSPATIASDSSSKNESETIGALKFFTFGMSHKVRIHYYKFLKEILDQLDQDYIISISTGFHEGESIGDFYNYTLPSFSEIFGKKLNFMGMLSDSIVLDCLNNNDYFVAFFSNGLRENNSSAIASLGANTALITNLDEMSPKSFIHNVNCHDINKLESIDINSNKRKEIRESANQLSKSYSWNKLISELY